MKIKPKLLLLWMIFPLGAIAIIISLLPVRSQQKSLPDVATVTDLVNGDLACYVDLVDMEGKKYQGIYATFEICEKVSLLNKQVKLSYQEESFSDCEGIEPCGKSQTQLAIVEMNLLKD